MVSQGQQKAAQAGTGGGLKAEGNILGLILSEGGGLMQKPMEERLREVARRLDAMVTAKTPDRPWKPINVGQVMALAGSYVADHAEQDMMVLYDVADQVEKLLGENYELRQRLGMDEREEVPVG